MNGKSFEEDNGYKWLRKIVRDTHCIEIIIEYNKEY